MIRVPIVFCSGKDEIKADMNIFRLASGETLRGKLTPLDGSGWIFQEFVLAPHIFFFQHHSISFHCSSSYSGDVIPHSIRLLSDEGFNYGESGFADFVELPDIRRVAMGLPRHLSALGQPGELYMLQYNFQPDLTVNDRQCGCAAAEFVGDLDGDLDRLLFVAVFL